MQNLNLKPRWPITWSNGSSWFQIFNVLDATTINRRNPGYRSCGCDADEWFNCAPDLSSFDKTSYSTFKWIQCLQLWMWNKAFYRMTLEESLSHICVGSPLCELVYVLPLSSFDITSYSTFKWIQHIQLWMWNKAFCRMTLDICLPIKLNRLNKHSELLS